MRSHRNCLYSYKIWLAMAAIFFIVATPGTMHYANSKKHQQPQRKAALLLGVVGFSFAQSALPFLFFTIHQPCQSKISGVRCAVAAQAAAKSTTCSKERIPKTKTSARSSRPQTRSQLACPYARGDSTSIYSTTISQYPTSTCTRQTHAQSSCPRLCLPTSYKYIRRPFPSPLPRGVPT